MSEKKNDVDLEQLMAELNKLNDMPVQLQLGMDMLLTEKRLIQEEADKKKQPIDDKLANLNEHYKRLTGGYYDAVTPREILPLKTAKARAPKAVKTKPLKTTSKGKRVRRGPEDLKAHAELIVKVIRKAGAKGANIKEIAKAAPGKITGSLKDYVKAHTGVVLGDTGGQRKDLRYLIK
jgi:hypothetical protein